MRGETGWWGGVGGPAVLLGRAVVQGVVGVGQRGPAGLANVQGADGLIPQPHRAGRGSGRKGRGGASGTSHLSHAGHATTEKKQPPRPKTTNTQAETKNKLMRRGEEKRRERRKIKDTGSKQICGGETWPTVICVFTSTTDSSGFHDVRPHVSHRHNVIPLKTER